MRWHSFTEMMRCLPSGRDAGAQVTIPINAAGQTGHLSVVRGYVGDLLEWMGQRCSEEAEKRR